MAAPQIADLLGYGRPLKQRVYVPALDGASISRAATKQKATCARQLLCFSLCYCAVCLFGMYFVFS